MDFVDVTPTDRLYPDCKLQVLQSGNGIIKDSYRRPVKMGKDYYYRFKDNKRERVDSIMLRVFGLKVVCDEQWFKDHCKSIEHHNAVLKKFYDDTKMSRDCDRKRKLSAMARIVEGTIVRAEAEKILGHDTVSKLLGETEIPGTMKIYEEEVEKYQPFNEFTVQDVEHITAKEWGF